VAKKKIIPLVILLSACAPAQTLPTIVSTDTPTLTATATTTVTKEPPDIEATVQSAIIQTQSAYTPTPEPTATPLPTIENTSLRIKAMPRTESKVYMTESEADAEWVKAAEFQARNLAIAYPYHWDFYLLDKQTEWEAVYEYYRTKTEKRGYAPKRNSYNAYIGMGLASYKKGDAYIYVQFWKDYDGRPAVMVFYKNVIS